MSEPSTDAAPPTDESTGSRPTRRRFLAAVGTGTLAATAGCQGSLPGTGPESLSTEVIEESDERIAWQYPYTEDDGEGIGYAALERRRPVEYEGDRRGMRFRFNATTQLHDDFEFDWYRARVRTPTSYHQRHGDAEYLFGSPGQWEGFHVYFHRTGTYREAVIEHRGVDTEGTILTPFVLNPGPDPMPEALHCSFTLRASEPGWFGRAVTASDGGRLEFAADA
jgi:hypothetical protein